MTEDEQLYRCQHCEKVVASRDIIEDIENGGTGMCYCEWTPDNRVYNEYVPITSLPETSTTMELTDKEIEIILNIRAITGD